MINNAILIERLMKNPGLRYAASGAVVATFTLAANCNFANQSGNCKADLVSYAIWHKLAETLANYARKGTLLGVTRRIQTRSYGNQQGQRVYVTEIVADNPQLLESRSASENRQQNGGFQSFNQSAGGFGGNNNSNRTSQSSNGMPDFDRDTSDPFGSSSTIDIPDDDLPF